MEAMASQRGVQRDSFAWFYGFSVVKTRACTRLGIGMEYRFMLPRGMFRVSSLLDGFSVCLHL